MAPPYDVISSAERVHLASRHPANAVLVELPEPDLQGGRDRYQVAADLFTRWQADGTLRPDPTPCLYPYRMTDTDGSGLDRGDRRPRPGRPRRAESDILPHEQTLPKPKSDRLDLLRATRANLSPIWGLSMRHGLTATFDPTDDEPTADAYDDDGVRHQLWVLDDRDAIDAIAAAVAEAPVVIADGHHRYQTALTYQAECRAENGNAPGPYDLGAGPHRGAGRGPAHGRRHPSHDLGPAARLRPRRRLPRPGSTSCGPGRPTSAPSARWPTRTRSPWSPAAAPTCSSRWRRPTRRRGTTSTRAWSPSCWSHLPPHESMHRHSVAEAIAALNDGEAQAAFLLRPVTVAQIEAWAAERKQMAPKTTYFSPKPRTGMVFRSLDLYP